jgi:glycosyltransferase involved in cell wall biosynthesis
MKQQHVDLPSPWFSVYIPEIWLPRLYRPKWLAKLMFGKRIKAAQRVLTNRGCQKIILYLWHPMFEDALTEIPFDCSCYHIDDEYTFSSGEYASDPQEIRVIRSVDEVFAISPGLLERKGNINPHTTFTPEGVDFSAYATPVDIPEDLAPIPTPRIGYTGVLKKQLDWPLLIDLAKNHPEWSFVFVGPQAPHPEVTGAIQDMEQFGNVFFLGTKSQQELAAYPQHFDVCLMPYRVDRYTDSIYPLKLHEYLASGRPVVAAPIRSLKEFTRVIALASTYEEWTTALARSLDPSESSSVRVETRRDVARLYDWSALIALIAQKMCRKLGSPYLDKIEKAML